MNPNGNPAGVAAKPGYGSGQASNFRTNSATNRRRHQGPFTTDPVEGFLDAMRAAGIEPIGGFIPSGKLQRFRVAGDKPGSKNGWAVLHLDPPPSGAFGSNKTGVREIWSAKSRDRMIESTDLLQRVETLEAKNGKS